MTIFALATLALCQLDTPPASGLTRVLLADEPTSAMDPKHAIAAMRLFRELAASGLAVAVVLHDLNLADHYADDAAALDDTGRLIASGPVRASLEPSILSRVFDVPFIRVGDVRRKVLVPAPDDDDTMGST